MKFPQHINQKISLMWGTKELLNYLDSILLSDREKRQGFSKEIFQTLWLVREATERILDER